MRMLITGADGQLGRALAQTARDRGHDVHACDRAALDIADAGAVHAAMSRHAPEVVLNAAAYTDVEGAETARDEAFVANALGPEILAKVCRCSVAVLVHYSTDYVFSGDKRGAYEETDEPSPLNVYGESKLQGERRIAAACPRHLVLRTSWVFSATGRNFVTRMLELGRERDTLSVVTDQSGKPTSATELAHCTLDALEQGGERWGTYHLAQPEACSWYDFACEIFAVAAATGRYRAPQVSPTDSASFRTVARRPANSVLRCDKFESDFAIEIRPWLESLESSVGEILNA